MQSKFLLSHKICEELQSTTANKMLAYTILILRSLELSTIFALFHTNSILACVCNLAAILHVLTPMDVVYA